MTSLDNIPLNEKIRAAIGKLLLRYPFYGFLVSRMKLVEANADNKLGGFIQTAATDGANIYYSKEFFEGLNPEQITFVVAHEIMHCVYHHIARFKAFSDKDHMYWNMAADYVINNMLLEEGVITEQNFRKEWLKNRKYLNWTTEEVYKDLVDNNAQKQNSMDQHIVIQIGGDGNGNPGDSDKDLKDAITKALGADAGKKVEENLEKFKDLIVQAYQVAKDAGKVPGHIETVINDLVNPKINWRTLLNVNIQSIFKSQMTWMKPNRRNAGGMILPRMTFEDTVDLCIAIDTSGSISEEMKVEFLSEICGILNYYTTFNLKIWCFDTEVHAYKEFDVYNINELPSYVLEGGGGTEIRSNFDFMQEEGIVPKQFICLTDAYNGSNNWGPDDYCPCTFIIHSNPSPQVPFGVWAPYD